jgi:transcriptional regulator with XRE-family HTH domain
MADEPNPIDIEVGRRLKQRRTLLGMSQERLGDLLGITYQQIQKYERGTNRIGSSRLYEICRILDVPSSYFIEGAETRGAPQRLSGLAEDEPGFAYDGPPAASPPQQPALVEERETLEMVRAFKRIRDPQVRRRLFDLAKALGALSYRTGSVTGPT